MTDDRRLTTDDYFQDNILISKYSITNLQERLMRKIGNLTILLLLLSVAGSAKVKISEGIFLDAEFRPLIEFDNRDFNNNTGYDGYATFMSRLGFTADNIIENTQIYLLLGDSRKMGYSNPYISGTPTGPNGYDNNVGVIKAYIEVRKLIDGNFYFRIGRMSNDQGRHYLIGPGAWTFYGPRTFDGIKVGYEGKKYSLNVWNFYGVSGDRHWYPDPEDPRLVPDSSQAWKRDNTLTGADLSILHNQVNFLLFLDLDQSPVEDSLNGGTNVAYSRATAAVNAHHDFNFKRKTWSDFDFAYQFGSMGHGSGNGDISAFMVAGDIGYQFYEPRKMWAGLGFHILSGDDGANSEQIHYFYDKYCSKHAVFGHMDLFTSDTGIKSRGLRDLILRGGFNIINGLDYKFDLHHFSVEEAFTSSVDSKGAYNLGVEWDSIFRYNIRKGLKNDIGIDFFWPTEDWKGKEGDMATYFYLMMTASF